MRPSVQSLVILQLHWGRPLAKGNKTLETNLVGWLCIHREKKKVKYSGLWHKPDFMDSLDPGHLHICRTFRATGGVLATVRKGNPHGGLWPRASLVR